MSNDTIARGVIEVELDGSGVDVGIAKTEQSLENFGKSAEKAGKRASDGIEKIGEGGDKAATKVDNQTRRLIQSIERATASMQTGARGSTEYYRALANSRGVNLKVLQPYLDQLDGVAEKTRIADEARRKMLDGQKFIADLNRTNDALGKTQSQLLAMRAAELGVADAAAPMIAKLRQAELATGAAGMSVKQYQAALRGLPAQMTDIFVSLQGGQRPLTVLLQQGGQLKDMFGGIGSAVRAAGGYILGLVNPFTVATAAVAGLGYAYYASWKETSQFQNALISTGNYAGLTAGKMRALAVDVGAVSGHYSKSIEATRLLAATGTIAGQNIEIALRGVVAGLEVTGKEVSDLVGDFTRLGKDPLKGLLDLNEQYNFLTIATYKQVKALQDQGKHQEAATTAFKAYSDAMQERKGELERNTGYIERAWDGITAAINRAKSALFGWGAESTSDELRKRAASIEAQISGIRNVRSVSNIGRLNALKRELVEVNAELEKFNIKEREAKKRSDAALADKQKIEQAGVYDTYMNARVGEGLSGSYAKRLNDENEAFKKATIGLKENSKEYQDALKAHQTAVAEIRRSASSKTDSLTKHDQEEMQRLVSSIRARTAEYDLETKAGVNATESQKLRIKVGEELASTTNKLLLGSKGYIQALLDENAAAEASALAAIKRQKLQTDLNAIYERGSEALRSVAEQMALEYQLYGKSNDARELAAISLKEMATAEAKLIELKKQHGELDPQIIANIRAEALERGKSTEAMQGQIRALGYARQLREENKQYSLDLIFDDRARAKAQLAIDDQMWQERIKLAGEGTQAQKELQQEYATWYANQANKPAVEEWRRSVAQYDDIFRKGFAAMLNRGDGTWKSWSQSLLTTFKTTVADQIYKMLAQPFVVKLVGSILGVNANGTAANGGGLAGFMNSFSGTGGGSLSNNFFGGLGNMISSAGTLFGSQALSQFASGMSGRMVGAAAGMGPTVAGSASGIGSMTSGWGAAGATFAKAMPWVGAAVQAISGDVRGAAFTAAGAAIGSIIPGIGTAIGAMVGSLIGSLTGGKDLKKYGSVSAGTYQNGEYQNTLSGTFGDRNAGANASLSGLNQAFSTALGGLLKTYGLSDSISTSSDISSRTNTRGGFYASFEGGSVSFGRNYGKAKHASIEKAFEAMVGEVMGKTLASAIQQSKLPEGIRSLFSGMTDQTQVANMLTASINLSDVQKQLADRFGITVDQSAKAAKATGLAGDELIAFVNKINSVAYGFKSTGEVILAGRVKLEESIEAVMGKIQMPASLVAFDEILKSIDKSTQAGIQDFSDLFSLRDGFAEFTQGLDSLKAGVSNSVLGLKSPAEQLAAMRKGLIDSFAELDLTVPGSVRELIALGESIDFTSEKGLTLASVFPALVEQFLNAKNATDSLVGSMKALDINRYKTLVDYSRAAAYQRNGISLSRLPSFDVGTNSVPRDMVAMVHANERIIPAADNRELMERLSRPSQESLAIVVAIRELQAQVAALQSQGKATEQLMRQISKLLNNVTSGGDAMRTEQV